MRLGREHHGFTLIELLIVVAIIAILAAIAIPNFLEAQTRSKVSRVKADIRSLATAEEAYFVDWNSYTFGQGSDQYNLVWQGWRLLTTPVQYMSNIPLDAFGLSMINGVRRLNILEFGTGVAGVAAAGRSFTDAKNQTGMPSNTYEIESDGPDKNDDTANAYVTGDYPMWDPNNIPGILGLITIRQMARLAGAKSSAPAASFRPAPRSSCSIRMGSR